MTAHCRVGDDSVVEEDRLRHDEIGQVVVTLIGIVLIDDVPGLEAFRWDADEARAKGHRHRGEVDRDIAYPLHRKFTAARQEAAGQVTGLLPEIRIGGADDYGLHLRDCIDESGAQHR